ncbi:hypothetical protein V5799_008854, partial [Amblyomma americanum]
MQAWMPYFGVMAHLLANSLHHTVSQQIKPRKMARDWLPQTAATARLLANSPYHGLWQLIKL